MNPHDIFENDYELLEALRLIQLKEWIAVAISQLSNTKTIDHDNINEIRDALVTLAKNDVEKLILMFEVAEIKGTKGKQGKK